MHKHRPDLELMGIEPSAELRKLHQQILAQDPALDRAGPGPAAPVLAADDSESQVQIPFEARGNTLSLALDGANGRRMLAPLPLEPAAPVIFVDRDGSPMLLDADSGVMLDAMKPARSRSRALRPLRRALSSTGSTGTSTRVRRRP